MFGLFMFQVSTPLVTDGHELHFFLDSMISVLLSPNPKPANMDVLKVNVTIDLDDDQKLKSGSLNILKLIRPGWTASQIHWRVFTDGITNKLLGAWSGSDNTDTVLIRVYGRGTEKIINRNMEIENMIKYRKLGSGSQLYATFNNGICFLLRVPTRRFAQPDHVSPK